MSYRSVQILLVEDNEFDIKMTLDFLQTNKIINDIAIARDGEEAINYLYNNINNLPDLVLLDLNLPRKTGKEVLYEIRHNDLLKDLPVIILTTSNHPRDIEDTTNLNANCYIVKPLKLKDFICIIKRIEDFWIQIKTSKEQHVECVAVA